MTDDCSSCTTKDPSLYHQYCCLPVNNGKSIKQRDHNGLLIMFFCPIDGLSDAVCETVRQYQSCREALENEPNAVSGYYNITQSNGSIISVYCDMEGSNCDGTGGWTRVAYINMTEPNATCPEGLYQYSFDNKTLCDRNHNDTNGCDGTFFSARGLNYTKVCGQVRGYQYGTTDGIYDNFYGSPHINGAYVDGVSITHGSPRNHIWTYVVGQEETDNKLQDCPCNLNSTEVTPSYVGNDYYCESGVGNATQVVRVFFPNDPLWDGQQCGNLENPCCTSPKMPWFVKTLNQSTTDVIELRLCTSEGFIDEASPVDIIEIYIK